MFLLNINIAVTIDFIIMFFIKLAAKKISDDGQINKIN